jgi:hypothetical protein
VGPVYRDNGGSHLLEIGVQGELGAVLHGIWNFGWSDHDTLSDLYRSGHHDSPTPWSARDRLHSVGDRGDVGSIN